MMPDPFLIGAQRYRERRANAAGGPYGRLEPRILGMSPVPDLVFFDDFVQIDSTQASTNLYGSGTLQLLEDFLEGTRHDVIQLFLKAERPFNNIRSLVVPFGPTLIKQSATFGSVAGGGTFTATNNMHFALIRVPMTAGASPPNTFGLDQLTWNNSHAAVTGFSGTSTLYATASNFELFTDFKLYGQTFGILNPTAFEDYQISHQAHSSAYYFDQFGEQAKADNGPFYGMHIFWKPVLEGGAPIDQNGSRGKLDATIRAIKPSGTLPRVYGVTSDFAVMSGV